MKITGIELSRISVPLFTPFKTAVRTVHSVEDIIVKVHTDQGLFGYGEAPPTGPVTGDTTLAIIGAIEGHIAPAIQGLDIDNFDEALRQVQTCMAGNSSAKAAVDIALHDLFCKKWNLPLQTYLGGGKSELTTDITISVNDPSEMAQDARKAVSLGYETLKIKVGKDPDQDLARLEAVRQAAGPCVQLRLDANQGWKPKQAVRILEQMQERGLDIELVEQPVAAHDLDGLAYVTRYASVPVMADESIFSPADALRVLQERCADYINIKLMKCGGLRNALRIVELCELYGVECMMGCMLESNISISAAVHLAMAKSVITKIDLDGPVLCRENPVQGGALFENSRIRRSEGAGLGITGIEGLLPLIR